MLGQMLGEISGFRTRQDRLRPQVRDAGCSNHFLIDDLNENAARNMFWAIVADYA